MIARAWRKLHGSAVVAAHLRAQRSIPFLPRRELETVRDRRIRRMIAYAARTVPYYRDLLAREGIDPRDIRGAAELDRLPVLPRDAVRAEPHLFTAEGRAGRSALSCPTSGSTGSPMHVQHDRRSLLVNLPVGERERDPVIRGCGGSFRPKELYVANETAAIKEVTAFYERNTLLPVRPRRRFVSVLEPIEKVAEIANSERPDVLVGYGGWIDLFFKTVAAHGIELLPPKMVVYVAEALPHGGRSHIEETYGIPVLSKYSAAEAFKIGYFCERRTGFHLHEDLCHVRVVGADGESLPPGEPGEIVISNLVNRASVFLNYRIGDVGSISEESCPCGRTFKLLSELEGRVEDMLPLADGTFVHPRSIWQVFKQEREVLQYQLTQQEPTRFELNLFTIDEPGFQRARDRALPELQDVLGPEAVIDVSRRTRFDRRGGRKFRAVASLCARPAPS